MLSLATNQTMVTGGCRIRYILLALTFLASQDHDFYNDVVAPKTGGLVAMTGQPREPDLGQYRWWLEKAVNAYNKHDLKRAEQFTDALLNGRWITSISTGLKSRKNNRAAIRIDMLFIYNAAMVLQKKIAAVKKAVGIIKQAVDTSESIGDYSARLENVISQFDSQQMNLLLASVQGDILGITKRFRAQWDKRGQSFEEGKEKTAWYRINMVIMLLKRAGVERFALQDSFNEEWAAFDEKIEPSMWAIRQKENADLIFPILRKNPHIVESKSCRSWSITNLKLKVLSQRRLLFILMDFTFWPLRRYYGTAFQGKKAYGAFSVGRGNSSN